MFKKIKSKKIKSKKIKSKKIKSKKIKSKKINSKSKNINKFHGGSNSIFNQSVNSSIDNSPEKLNLFNILTTSFTYRLKITSLITFKGITLKIDIIDGDIIFKMGKEDEDKCIYFSISLPRKESILEDYFYNYNKSSCIEKFQFNEEVNNFFFELFNAINIEIKINKFKLIDNSKLLLNMCDYSLSNLKMIESGYSFYNKFGFYNEIEITKMNEFLAEIKQKSEMNIINFFGDKNTVYLKTILTSIFEEYLKLNTKLSIELGIQNNNITEKNLEDICKITKISVLCKYILEICNQPKNADTEKKIKGLVDIFTSKIFEIIFPIAKTIGIIDYFNLRKIYDHEITHMSSFNKSTLAFEMIPYKKYKFDIEYINLDSKTQNSTDPILHIIIT